MRVRPIDIALGKDGEFGPVLTLSECFDLCIRTRFLLHKLVGGHGEDLEALRLILLMELHHFFVVDVCEASFGGDVDHHGTLLTTAEVCQIHINTVDVLCA